MHDGGGGTYEDGDDKRIAIGTADTTLAVALFNSEEMPSGGPANMTYQVDMRLLARRAEFAPGADRVYVAGNFTVPQWEEGAIEMKDTDGDTIYATTTMINSARWVKYRFIHSAGSANEGTRESRSDREYWVVDGDQTISQLWDDLNVGPYVEQVQLLYPAPSDTVELESARPIVQFLWQMSSIAAFYAFEISADSSFSELILQDTVAAETKYLWENPNGKLIGGKSRQEINFGGEDRVIQGRFPASLTVQDKSMLWWFTQPQPKISPMPTVA